MCCGDGWLPASPWEVWYNWGMEEQKAPNLGDICPLFHGRFVMADQETKVTKSGEIRRLAQGGMTRGQIARTLGLRYQHVRNVLVADEARRLASMVQLDLNL